MVAADAMGSLALGEGCWGCMVHSRSLLYFDTITAVLSNVLLPLPSWEKCLGYTSAAEAAFSVLGTLFWAKSRVAGSSKHGCCLVGNIA